MKLKSKSLYAALDSIVGIIRPGCPNPAASCVKLIGSAKQLKLTATSNDERALEIVQLESGEKLECCVSGERLKAAASYAGEFLELSIDGSHLIVKSNAICKLATVDVAEYPPDENIKFEPVNISATELANGIGAVGFASMKTDGRPLLKSVHVLSNGETAVCEACDGSNGAFYDFKCEAKLDLLISATNAARIVSELGREGAKFLLSENIIKVEHKFGSYWCKKLEGKYPDLNARRKDKDYMPSIKIGELPAKEVAAALGCAIEMQTNPNKINAVDVAFNSKGMRISHDNFNRLIPGKFTPLEVSLNAKTVKECFEAFTGNVKAATGDIKFLHLTSGNLSAMSMPLRGEAKEEK